MSRFPATALLLHVLILCFATLPRQNGTSQKAATTRQVRLDVAQTIKFIPKRALQAGKRFSINPTKRDLIKKDKPFISIA